MTVTDERIEVTPAEVAAYADGQLSGEEAERVEEALAADPALRAELSRMTGERQALADALGNGGEDDSTDPTIEALAARLDGRLRAARSRQRAVRLGIAAAAVAAIGALGWAGHAVLTGTPVFSAARSAAQSGVPGFVADAAGAHAVFADDTVHPVEFFAADEPVMQRWFASHLGDQAMIPHLEEIGFELIGGRLLGDAEGAMAQVLYENAKGDRVSLVFGRREVPGDADLRLVHVGKQYASYWRDGDYAWAVVEDSPGADVSAVATHVAALIRATKR